MPTQTQIHFESNIKNVDWKLIARIQDERKLKAKCVYAMQSRGGYQTNFIKAKKEISQLKEEIKKLKQQLNNGKSIDI